MYYRKATLDQLQSIDRNEFIRYYNEYPYPKSCCEHFGITEKVFTILRDELNLKHCGRGGSAQKNNRMVKLNKLIELIGEDFVEFHKSHSDNECISHFDIHLKPKSYKKFLEALGIEKHSRNGNEELCRNNKYGCYFDGNKIKDFYSSYTKEDWSVRNSKIKETKLLKYGDCNYNNNSKSWETKISRGSLRQSKKENNYYEYLKTIYSEEDILRQYKDERYPFHCDFYIKSIDLFIECNYWFGHGGHAFDPNSIEDMNTLEVWKEKAKTSKIYEANIITWTIKDPLKRETARLNKLNYLEVFN